MAILLLDTLLGFICAFLPPISYELLVKGGISWNSHVSFVEILLFCGAGLAYHQFLRQPLLLFFLGQTEASPRTNRARHPENGVLVQPKEAFPYELVQVASFEELERLKSSSAPKLVILVGDGNEVHNLAGSIIALTYPPEEILALASKYNVNEWASDEVKDAEISDLGISLGKWPSVSAKPSSCRHPHCSENLVKRGTFAALIPCGNAWAIPAYLPVGIWINVHLPTFMWHSPRGGGMSLAQG